MWLAGIGPLCYLADFVGLGQSSGESVRLNEESFERA